MSSNDTAQVQTRLLRDVAAFQIKMLLEALRDLILIPLSLIAALIDMARSGSHKPTLFYGLLKLGRRFEHWIDLWSAADRDESVQPATDPSMNADWLLDRVETLIRDPAGGVKNAQVLKRWAQMRMARASGAARQSDQDRPN